jgi:hypothetical protein
MKKLNCDKCTYYKYTRCIGYDCEHPNTPDISDICFVISDCTDCTSKCARINEPLAENRNSNTPKWCPLLKKG